VSEEGSHLTNASTLSDTVLPSTPEGPGEMYVSPLGKASPRLSGVSRLMKTPRQKQRHSVDLSGLKSLVKTPKTVKSPELSGVKQLMKTPRAQKSPASASGATKKLLGTLEDVSGTPELDGIRKLMKTPKARKSMALDGVRQLMRSPKAQKSPALDGVRKLVKTPKDTARTPSLGGIRTLVKTPKVQKSPSLAGVKKLLKTPKPQKSPKLAGLKAMMRTPNQQQSPVLVGVRQLMKTPRAGPKSPDFVGVSEMLASPQADGFTVSVPKKKTGKKISSPASRVLTPKARVTRGKKVLEKPTAKQLALDVSLSGRKRGTSSSHVADDDVVVGKKPKLGKSGSEAAPRSAGKEVSESIPAQSPASRKGRSRSRRQEAEGTEDSVSKDKKSKVSSSSHVAETRKKVSKRGTSEVVDVNSSSETAVKSRAKSTKASKKAADLSTVPALDKTAVVRLEAADIAAGKKSARHVTVVSPVSSPAGPRRGGRVSKFRTANAAAVARDSVKEAQKVRGKKPRTAGNQNDTLVIDQAESQEDNEVRVMSKVQKAAAPVSGAKTAVRTTKGKESHVDLAADKPTAARRGKSATSSKKLLDDRSSVGSAKSPHSTRRGKRQVTVSLEPLSAAVIVEMQQKNKKSSTAATPAGERRRKHQLVEEETQESVEDNTVKAPSGGQKDQETARGKGSKKPVQRGKPAASKQTESTPSSSVPAKSPVTTRRGRRQVVVEEAVSVTDKTKLQKKGQEQPAAAARVAGGRRGKQGEPQPAVESSSVKTPSRTRKRAQTSDEVPDAPASKRQRAEEAPVVEQPMKKATKPRGKSSAPAEPLVQPDKSQRKAAARKQSQSVVKKAGKKPEQKQNVVDKLASSKTKKNKDENVLVEKNKASVVSPPATRSKRTKR